MSKPDSLTTLSLAQLRDGLQSGQFSSVELTEAWLARVAQFDGELNSFISVLHDDALAQARQADQQRQADSVASPLAGIPYALKDLFCTKGVLTSCGSRMLENFTAPYDAHVASQLKAAGAILLGKNNMDEFAMGSSNENAYYGAVKNPWNPAHVPGGSSGGGSAAVAARLSPMVLGTDTGGSIRQPASFCGITGIKPTYGRVSRYGMIAFASSLDQCGPMAASAEDCALTLNSIAGFDPRDSTSAQAAVPDYTATLNEPLAGLRIGLPRSFFAEGLEQAVASRIDEAVKTVEKLGATVKDIELPNAHLAVPAYYIVAPAEASSNLSRFDGVRFGFRCDNPQDLQDLYERSRWEGFGDEVKRRIVMGTYALSAGYYDAYYRKAQQVRRLIKQDFVAAFQEVDVIMGPAAPTTAFKLGEKSDDPVSMYLADIYTIPTSLAGLPGMSFPIGFDPQGLPVGMQLIGNYFDEARMLNVAHQYQQHTDWHQRVPERFA